MPQKIGGGNQLQDYDESTGRYGCSGIGFSRNYAKSAQMFVISPTFKDPNLTSSIMPNYRNAQTPVAKFLKYSLNPEHQLGKHKARVYKAALGFTAENYESLYNQIHQSITSGTARYVGMTYTNYGAISYTFAITVHGPTGKVATVIVSYGFNKGSGKPSMFTNYVKEKH